MFGQHDLFKVLLGVVKSLLYGTAEGVTLMLLLTLDST